MSPKKAFTVNAFSKPNFVVSNCNGSCANNPPHIPIVIINPVILDMLSFPNSFEAKTIKLNRQKPPQAPEIVLQTHRINKDTE
jgi:hypothetical protein